MLFWHSVYLGKVENGAKEQNCHMPLSDPPKKDRKGKHAKPTITKKHQCSADMSARST